MNLMVLRKSRHKPAPGDLFVANVLGERWLAGRVLLTNSNHGLSPGHGILIYIYKQHIADPGDIETPLEPDLLVPPMVVNESPWRQGFFVHVANAPLQAQEVLPRHIFRVPPALVRDHLFEDEFREPTAPAAPGEYWEWGGLGGYKVVDDKVSRALGLPDKPDRLTPLPPSLKTARREGAAVERPVDSEKREEVSEYSITLYIPTRDAIDEDLELDDLEDDLIDAVEKARAGKWEGHGTDLRDGLFDMRFFGPDADRIVESMRPVLKRAQKRLPKGWYLTTRAGDDSEERRVEV